MDKLRGLLGLPEGKNDKMLQALNINIKNSSVRYEEETLADLCELSKRSMPYLPSAAKEIYGQKRPTELLRKYSKEMPLANSFTGMCVKAIEDSVTIIDGRLVHQLIQDFNGSDQFPAPGKVNLHYVNENRFERADIVSAKAVILSDYREGKSGEIKYFKFIEKPPTFQVLIKDTLIAKKPIQAMFAIAHELAHFDEMNLPWSHLGKFYGDGNELHHITEVFSTIGGINLALKMLEVRPDLVNEPRFYEAVSTETELFYWVTQGKLFPEKGSIL